jgi:ribosomal protein L24E
VSECYYCHKPISDEYILLIDEEGERFGFCSTNCMDLLFEYMENEDFEEDE